MTGLRARGAMVSTYWSVLVTVWIAHTEITEIGMRIAASTSSTHAEIRRGRCPRRVFAAFVLVVPVVVVPSVVAAASDPVAAVSDPVASGIFGGPDSALASSSFCIWGSVSLIWAFPFLNS